MLRSFLISLSKAGWAQRTITRWGFAWRMASRFVAGETSEDAIRTVRALNARGILATLDHLGENTSTPQEAEKAVADILVMLTAIEQAGVRAGVSIKLSQIGLALDADLCRRNLERILQAAQAQHNFVRIDMEDSPFTQATLDLFLEVHARGFENVGLVIQSYLYRSEEDVRRLVAGGARVRLVKGAYVEPAEIAFPRKADVDHSFDHLTELLLDASRTDAAPPPAADGKTPPLAAIATHDVRRIDHARAYAAQTGLPKAALEFQMLYGIRRDLQEALVAAGYPVRVYVPYGTHWYPYFMRRLAERPANLWFFVSNFFRK